MNVKNSEKFSGQLRKTTENSGLVNDGDRLNAVRNSPARQKSSASPKRISRALDYWEKKVDPPTSNSGDVPRSPVGQKKSGPKPFERPQFNPNNGQKFTPKATSLRSSDNSDRLDVKGGYGTQKTVGTPPLKTVIKPVPGPKPPNLHSPQRVPSSLHRSSPPALVKNRVNAFKSDNTANKLPPKKPQNSNTDRHSSPAINPLPKPVRTFTFDATDDVTRPMVWNRNLIRVSSDAAIAKGSGIAGNLSTLLSGNSFSNLPKNASSSEYEEVVLFQTNQDSTPTDYNDNRLSRKWVRQHNYEEVDDPTLSSDPSASLSNYDRIELGSQTKRPHTLTDLQDGYSRLEFQQDLHTSRQNHASLMAYPQSHPSQPTHNSLETSDSAMKSDQDLGKLQITDKIREAFNVIGRKYKHPQKTGEVDDDEFSSSEDEDSEEETDLNKFEQTLQRVRTLQRNYRKTLKYKSFERELAGADQEKTTLFEQILVCKVVKDPNNQAAPKVIYRFPAPAPGKPVGDEKTLAHFCFPDIGELVPSTEMPSQSYSFMLTRENGTRKFGCCRRVLPPGNEPRYPVVYCLISALGSFGLYQTILDEVERRHRVSFENVKIFLDSLYVERFPAPGRSIRVTVDDASDEKQSTVVLRRPFDTRLEHVDLQCLLKELGTENTIRIFASLLLERRVILCGQSLATLTACVHALRAVLYPFVWQHVFIPVLPPPMLDLCCSPTPLLIGVLETSLEKLKTLPLEEVLIINLSTRSQHACTGDELDIIPRKLQTALTNALVSHSKYDSRTEPNYDHAIDYESAERNTVISESFMHLFVEMIGHYQSHFQPVAQSANAQARHGRILRSFNRNSFYDDVTSRSVRRFLAMFMETQMFDGFIHSRELASPNYEGLFEQRISRHLLTAEDNHLNFKVFRTKMKKFVQSAIGGSSGATSGTPKKKNKQGKMI